MASSSATKADLLRCLLFTLAADSTTHMLCTHQHSEHHKKLWFCRLDTAHTWYYSGENLGRKLQASRWSTHKNNTSTCMSGQLDHQQQVSSPLQKQQTARAWQTSTCAGQGTVLLQAYSRAGLAPLVWTETINDPAKPCRSAYLCRLCLMLHPQFGQLCRVDLHMQCKHHRRPHNYPLRADSYCIGWGIVWRTACCRHCSGSNAHNCRWCLHLPTQTSRPSCGEPEPRVATVTHMAGTLVVVWQGCRQDSRPQLRLGCSWDPETLGSNHSQGGTRHTAGPLQHTLHHKLHVQKKPHCLTGKGQLSAHGNPDRPDPGAPLCAHSGASPYRCTPRRWFPGLQDRLLLTPWDIFHSHRLQA